MKATLLKDIISNCKGLQKYGIKGSTVIVICWHGEVAIVEDEWGKRFSVRGEYLIKNEPDVINKV